MRLPLRLADVVAVFAAVDALVALLVLQAAGRPLLAAVPVIGAVAGYLLYAASPSPTLRSTALAGLVVVLVLLPQLVLVAGRPPHAPVNDGVLINEAATERLLQGMDPYGHDYLHSLARTFYMPEVPVSFSLGHYVYMPGMILLEVPLRVVAGSEASFSWMWLAGLPLLALAAYWVGGTTGQREGALVAVALNPLYLFDYLYLLNDLFFLAPLLASFAFLRRRHAMAAGLCFGLALGIKQSALLLAPFLALAAWRELDAGARLRLALAAAAALAVLVIPFLAWNPALFMSDTAGFFYGTGVDSYPIRGIGLAGLLLRAGLIANRWAAFPAALLQTLGCLPLLGLALVRLRRAPTTVFWSRLWTWAGTFTLAVFFLGRVLAPNYLDLAVVLLALGLVSALQHEAPVTAPVSRRVEPAAGG